MRQQLLEVEAASLRFNALSESKAATEKLHLLVPNEEKRKAYFRLFKWVVSFATWRYGFETTPGKNDDIDEAGYTVQVFIPFFTIHLFRVTVLFPPQLAPVGHFLLLNLPKR